MNIYYRNIGNKQISTVRAYKIERSYYPWTNHELLTWLN